MTAVTNAPMLRNVAGFPSRPSCHPSPTDEPPEARVMGGLITLVVNADTRLLKARATTRPTATTTTSPRMRKFLNPLSTCVSLPCCLRARSRQQDPMAERLLRALRAGGHGGRPDATASKSAWRGGLEHQASEPPEEHKGRGAV